MKEQFFVYAETTITVSHQVMEERKSHISAIEQARHKQIYDKHNEFTYSVIDSAGREDYDNFIHETKKDILGLDKIGNPDVETKPFASKLDKLRSQCDT